jgi:HTH-type transcriptional regulator, sugar sensing transcriptional regulator
VTRKFPVIAEEPALNGSEALVELGFSPLEAKVYVSLLAGAPQTGYQVAHTIDKPVANTYKAIKSLERRGAILVTAGDKRVCRAVPYAKLLENLHRDFRDRCDRADEALAQLPPQSSDEGVYDLLTVDQVAERFRTMLEQAEHRVVIDAFPEVITAFTGDIERCAARGVNITVKVYEPLDISGVETIVAYHPQDLLERWPGQWLNIVIDSVQHMLAFLTQDCDGVHRAVWSDSQHLSSIYYCGIFAEITLDKIGAVLRRRGTKAEIEVAFNYFGQVDFTEVPGRRALFEQYSSDPDRTPENGKESK